MIQASSPLNIRRPPRRGGGAGSFAPPFAYRILQCAVCVLCLAVLHDRTVGDASVATVRQKVRVTQLGHTVVTRVCESTHET